MKKVIIYFLLLFNMFSATANIDNLLKSDKENFTETVEKDKVLVKKQGKVEKLVGQAFLRKDGGTSWYQLVQNTMVDEKVTIITMEKSELKIKLDNDIYVNVGPKTKLYIENLKSKPKTEAINEAGLKLLFGKVYSSINKKLETGAKYEIKSGSVVAGVRGTKFLVINYSNGSTEIKVYDGFVAINNTIDQKQFTIVKNEKVIIQKTGKAEEILKFEEKDLDEGFQEEGVKEELDSLKDVIKTSEVMYEKEDGFIFDVFQSTPEVPVVPDKPVNQGNKVIITIN